MTMTDKRYAEPVSGNPARMRPNLAEIAAAWRTRAEGWRDRIAELRRQIAEAGGPAPEGRPESEDEILLVEAAPLATVYENATNAVAGHLTAVASIVEDMALDMADGMARRGHPISRQAAVEALAPALADVLAEIVGVPRRG